jgi:hypothetical protein
MKLRLLVALSLVAGACGPVVQDQDASVDGNPQAGFNDQTVPRIGSVMDFMGLARNSFGIASTKFIVTAFGQPSQRDLRFYNTTFFSLHDEWYWYRLLNNAPIPGDDVAPVPGHRFSSIREIYAWARTQRTLPLDLQIADDRLYSWRFYELAFGESRRFGLGTLLRIPARGTTPERWAFELEYSDALTYAQLVTFFEMLTPRLPESIANNLYFLVRSSDHDALAQRMIRERLRYHDRVLYYRDIVVPGTSEVYSEGIAVGRMRVVRRGAQVDNPSTNDLLLYEDIPDFLPPAGGLLTAVPQTPLAHINLLARNRGIPNAHVAGLLEDPTIRQLERGYAPVVLYTQAPSRVVVAPITEVQYSQYQRLIERPARTVTTPPVASLPYLIDLSSRSPTEAQSLSTTIGGKCMGMITLTHEPGLAIPDRPHAITVRAYVEHLVPLRARILDATTREEFRNDARVRQTVLQGAATFRATHTTPADTTWINNFLVSHGEGDLLGSLARATGIRGLIETTPIAPDTLAEITRTLTTVHTTLASNAGLRFRSSSNAEDIEGFNGAGLYESFTGFLQPEAQTGSDRNKTIERAIRRVWGSFWSFEAFEERRIERIDHLSAAMAVLVHPRFDDELERSTGVCTFTILPPNSEDAERLDVNIQAGAESVANPNPMVLPEVLRVVRSRTGVLRIERSRFSSLSPNTALLSDDALRALFDTTGGVTHRWIERENTLRPEAQRGRVMTLDFEFHDMLPGWPRLASGVMRPARMVIKQTRTLEPGARTTLAEAAMWPIPRDVYVRVRRVSTETCSMVVNGVTVTTTALRALSDASLPPDVGFAMSPFEASLGVATRGGDLTVVGLRDNTNIEVNHTEFTSMPGAQRVYQFASATSARVGLDRVQIDGNGTITLTHDGAMVQGTGSCREEVRFATPRDFLLSLLPSS